MRKLPVGGSDAESFEAMRSRLLAIDVPLRPWLDARAFARNALLVADCLAQPAIARTIDELAKVGACDARCAGDVRATATALLHVLSKAGERRPRPPRVPGATDADARELRTRMIDVIERELRDSDEARLWLEVVRAGSDDDDLVLDLRALAHVYRRSKAELDDAWCDAVEDELRARQLADALEDEGAAGPSASEWRDWVARAYTLLLEVYEEACRVARFVSRGDVQVDFASPVAIARSRRAQARGERTVAPGAMGRLPPPPAVPTGSATSGTVSIGPEAVSVPPSPLPAAPPPLPAAPPPLPVEPPPLPVQPPPLPVPPPPLPVAVDATAEPAAPAPSSRPSARVHERRAVEMQVDFASDSNFYVGFTENLSEGGIFVATYVLHPIGSMLDLSIRLAGDAEPLRVRGEVRWTREPSWSGDLWPGMGVRFHGLAPEHEARIRAFLDTRDPLFFDD